MLTSSCLDYNNLLSPLGQKDVSETLLNNDVKSSPEPTVLKNAALDCDKVVFSNEAKALAANLTQDSSSSLYGTSIFEAPLEKTISTPDSAVISDASSAPENDIAWGPDLIEGWGTDGYLETTDEGFKGSLSFTTKYGSKVGLSAGEPGKDGSPSQMVNLVMQRKDGTIFTRTLEKEFTGIEGTHRGGGSIRITETEDDFEVEYSTLGMTGTDKDDIIITMGGIVRAGDGDDVIIGLKNTTVFGGNGDDSIMMVENSAMAENLKRGPQVLISGDSGDDTIYVNNISGAFSHILGSGSYIDDSAGGHDTIVVNRLGKNASLAGNSNGITQDIKIALLDGGRVELNGSNSTYNLVVNEATNTRKGWSHITIGGENNAVTASIDKLGGRFAINSKNSTVDVNVKQIGSQGGLHLGNTGTVTNAKIGKVSGAVTACAGKNNIEIESTNNAFIASYGGENDFKVGSLKNSLVYLEGGGTSIKADKAQGNVVFDSGGNSLSVSIVNQLDGMYFAGKDKKKFDQWARQFALSYAGGVNYGL